MNTLIERLISARKAAGFSQEDAGRHINMSRPTFIAIEKGSRELKPQELIDLASLFNVSVNRLLRPEAPPPSFAPHLRGELAKEQGNQALNEAIDKLAGFVDDYQFLLEKTHSRPLAVDVPQVSRSRMPIERLAARCAQDERTRLGLGEREPIGNLRRTLDEVGVHVFVDSLASKLAGLYASVKGFGYCILVNRKHPRDRMRWTVAHEFGHFLFDRDTPGVDYLDPQARRPESERFADAFASHFLMPEHGVRRQFEDAKARSGDVSVGEVIRMADFYSVSPMAMMLRLEELRLIGRGTWDMIKSTGVKIGEIKREAGVEQRRDSEPQIFPERYILLAIQAWNSDLITTSQFAKLLRVSPIEARELAESRSRSVIESSGNLEEISLSLNESVLDREHASV